jgi:cephalosporin hydroxylase
VIAMQEIIWELKPDLIIETVLLHGGRVILICFLTGAEEKQGDVLGHRYRHSRTE